MLPGSKDSGYEYTLDWLHYFIPALKSPRVFDERDPARAVLCILRLVRQATPPTREHHHQAAAFRAQNIMNPNE